MAPEPMPPAPPPLHNALDEESLVVDCVHHTYGRARKTCPPVAITSNRPKFVFIKIAQGSGRPLLPGSAPKGGKHDRTSQPSSTHLNSSVSWGSPSHPGHPSSSPNDACSREMRQQTGSWRLPESRAETRAPGQASTGEEWGGDSQTDRRRRWETHRKRTKKVGDRDGDMPSLVLPVNTSTSPVWG